MSAEQAASLPRHRLPRPIRHHPNPPPQRIPKIGRIELRRKEAHQLDLAMPARTDGIAASPLHLGVGVRLLQMTAQLLSLFLAQAPIRDRGKAGELRTVELEADVGCGSLQSIGKCLTVALLRVAGRDRVGPSRERARTRGTVRRLLRSALFGPAFEDGRCGTRPRRTAPRDRASMSGTRGSDLALRSLDGRCHARRGARPVRARTETQPDRTTAAAPAAKPRVARTDARIAIQHSQMSKYHVSSATTLDAHVDVRCCTIDRPLGCAARGQTHDTSLSRGSDQGGR